MSENSQGFWALIGKISVVVGIVATTPWVFTRVADNNTALEAQPGTFVNVTSGTLYTSTGWMITSQVTTIDTDDMDWSKLNVNFGKNFEKAIILSEVLSKEDIIKLYKKFRILRLFKKGH